MPESLQVRIDRYWRIAEARVRIAKERGKPPTLEELGRMEGLSRARISKILKDGPPSGNVGGRPRKAGAREEIERKLGLWRARAEEKRANGRDSSHADAQVARLEADLAKLGGNSG